jgi:hypothetical protein
LIGITPTTAAMKIDVAKLATGKLTDALHAFNVTPEVFDAVFIRVTKWNALSIMAVGVFGTLVVVFARVVVSAETVDTFHAIVAFIFKAAFCMQHALTMIAEILVGTVRIAKAYIVVDAFATFTVVLKGTFVIVGASFVIDTETILANKVNGTILVNVAVTIIRNARFVHAIPAPALFIAVARSSTLTLVITLINGIFAKFVTGALKTVVAVVIIT